MSSELPKNLSARQLNGTVNDRSLTPFQSGAQRFNYEAVVICLKAYREYKKIYKYKFKKTPHNQIK